MPDIEPLDVFMGNYNTIDIQTQNVHTYSEMEAGCQYTKTHRKQASLINAVQNNWYSKFK